MNELHRELAPITEQAWRAIEEEATRVLKRILVGRRLVDFEGPLGWSASAVATGRTRLMAEAPSELVEARLRVVQPLVEFRVALDLPREEIDAIARGAKDPDLKAVAEAARIAALAEDRAIFHGYPEGEMEGLFEAARSSTLTLTRDYVRYPKVVAEATNRLRKLGVDGPYAIALGPECFQGLTQTTSNGYPVIEHVRREIDGPILWAPAVDGAVVMSVRGGDFELTVGKDFSIGYLHHSAESVRLYLEESFTYRTLAPEAAVPLVYA